MLPDVKLELTGKQKKLLEGKDGKLLRNNGGRSRYCGKKTSQTPSKENFECEICFIDMRDTESVSESYSG